MRQAGVIALIIGLFLSGCAATSALDERQLGKLLEAYRTETGAAEARQQQGASRGIRRLEVEGTGPGQALRASVDLQDAPLAAAVPRLLTAAGVAYLFEGVRLYGTVTARFEGLPFGEALNLLLGTRRLAATLEQGVWIIRPAQGGAKEPGASAAESGRTSVEVALQHLDTKTAMELLNGLFPAKPTGRHRAVDEVRRQAWRQLEGPAKAEFKKTRFLWLKNPENLQREERTRLSALLRLNSPIVKGYLLKEDLRRFWDYRSTAWAEAHLRQWLWRAAHSRLAPFKRLAKMLRTHLDGVLAWTRIRVTNGALEGMNNKIKAISHRAFGYRTSWAYIANIYHSCAGLPLP